MSKSQQSSLCTKLFLCVSSSILHLFPFLMPSLHNKSMQVKKMQYVNNLLHIHCFIADYMITSPRGSVLHGMSAGCVVLMPVGIYS